MNKDQIISYLKSNDLDVQSGRASFFMCGLGYGSYADLYDELGKDFGPWFAKYERYQGFSQLCSKETIGGISDALFDEYMKDPSSLDEKMERQEIAGENSKNIWKNHEREGNESKDSLAACFEDYLKKTKLWWRYAAFGEDKGEVINRKVGPIFSEKFGWREDEAREILSILSHPEVQAAFTSYRKDFLDICIRSAEDRLSDDIITEYLERYFWMKTDFYEVRTYSKDILVSEIEKELSEGADRIKEEISQIDKNFREIKEKELELRKTYSFDQDDEKLIAFCKKISLWMDKRKTGMMEQIYYLFKMVERLARFNGMTYEEMSLCTVEEMLAINNGSAIPKDDIEKRKNRVFVCVSHDSPIDIFYGKDAEELIAAARREDEKALRGTVASRGGKDLVSGVARIVKDPEKDILGEGEFLVTSMTRVEFVPLMKKAGAIITDEGGMACHAAIVSRELGLPAIIGTKQATIVLKDGDSVEMDMKSGEIRKI